MAMDDRGTLPDDLAVIERDEHQMAGLREIGRQPLRIDGFVEDFGGDIFEESFVTWTDTADLKRHHFARCLGSGRPSLREGTGRGVYGVATISLLPQFPGGG
ncbi:hypothetical protein GCM10007937_32830 [Mesorhizobium albiziae]|nr:hypothetical protein GCM10007937_32830 [Mesorhizobium albiziae]